MRDVFVIGAYSSQFGKHPGMSHTDLAREAVIGVYSDAGDADRGALNSIHFSNCGLWAMGQASIRGQACLAPLVPDDMLPPLVPIINVEAACASGSLAFYGARSEILAGNTELALAVGVEKLSTTDQSSNLSDIFMAGTDNLSPHLWRDAYEELGKRLGLPFETGPDRTIFMDTYAMQARWHMATFGTTQRQLAMVAAKNHFNGCRNPKAQYHFDLSIEDILADREVSAPLTRSMCSPIGDGAAAVLLCSGDYLASLPSEVRERAILVAACELAGGRYRDIDAPSVTRTATTMAYATADVRPDDIDVAEVHDATAYSEIYQSEMLGFCEIGAGGQLAEAGETALGGRIPINTSGGLLSKGHPVGATGLSMIYELCLQLRGEAGERQVSDAQIALSENGGGQLGFDEALCAVTILRRNS